nr:cubilin-like [Procambarus clarkii]
MEKLWIIFISHTSTLRGLAACFLTKVPSLPRQSDPNQVTYIANTFALISPDNVSITYPYSRTNSYTGSTTWTFSAPNFNFNMMFQSNNLLNAAGFNISICPRRTSCHKLLNTSIVGSVGYDQTPGFWNLTTHTTLTQCEWWLVAPAGSRIFVGIYYSTLNATGCPLNYVTVNGRGEKTYPAATSSIFCGTGFKTFTSTNNTMYIAYQGQAGQSSGMFFTYIVL